MMRWPAIIPCLLAFGCAQVRDPQGGPQDRTAPMLVQAIPPDGSTHFQARRIVLRFDERIKLDRVRERLLISPAPIPAPEVVLGGSHEVHILLRGPLAPHTTYLFNIGESVADLTEGNAASGLTYVVSTGDHIDSLSIVGTVHDALSGAPASKVLVLAHVDGDTSNLAHGRPAYFTRSDSAGRYALPHMRAGSFRITALVDRNANYRYDLPSEEIAFGDSAVEAGGQGPALRMFRERATTQQASEVKVLPDRCWRLALARPSAGVTLRQLDRDDDPLTWAAEWNHERDTVLLWPSDTALLQGQRFVMLEDGLPVDTIVYRASGPMPYHPTLRSAEDPLTGRIHLMASRPLATHDTTRIRASVDSIVVASDGRIDTLDRRSFHFHAPPPTGTRLELLPGAFTDIYGATNDTTRIVLDPAAMDQTGSLKVQVRSDSSLIATAGPFILQLSDGQGRVVRRTTGPTLPFQAEWARLPAGTYALALVVDRDGDGRWTTGNWLSGDQPEEVLHQSGRIDLRAGWEQVITWLLER